MTEVTFRSKRVADTFRRRLVARGHRSALRSEQAGFVVRTEASRGVVFDVAGGTVVLRDEQVRSVGGLGAATVSKSALLSYIETALWSSTDDDGVPLDQNYSAADLAPEARAAMKADLADFMESADQYIEESGLSDEKVAHNFWLTRNRHGAGFWDLGLGPVGKRLTELAHAYGEVDLSLGEDGRLYVN